MAACTICGLHRTSGFNVSHSNRHTRRWFSPNIQKAKLTIDGKRKQVPVCTRCLRTLQNKYATTA